MSFKDFKKNREKFNTAVTNKVETLTKDTFEDDRFWQPTVGKTGNGYAIIRFLPAKDGEDVPFVQLFSHVFSGPGGWYFNNCLTTTRQNGGKGCDCPVCKSNSVLWESGIEANKLIVRGVDGVPGRKRKLNYISNILVVADKEHPENVDKVFLYKYGAKIFEKVQGANNPEFEDATPFNPFDMWEGANFKIKIKNKEGYRNYDDSEFEKNTSQVYKDEAKMEEVYNQLYSLDAFITPDQFKSYADLEARLAKVLGNSQPAKPVDETRDPEPQVAEKSAGKTRKAKAEKEKPVEDDSTLVDVDMDDAEQRLALFSKLAEE